LHLSEIKSWIEKISMNKERDCG